MKSGIGTSVGVGVNVGVGIGVFVDVAVGTIVSVGIGDGVTETPHAERKNITKIADKIFFKLNLLFALKYYVWKGAPNGLRYLRWGRDGEAVQPEKC